MQDEDKAKIRLLAAFAVLSVGSGTGWRVVRFGIWEFLSTNSAALQSSTCRIRAY